MKALLILGLVAAAALAQASDPDEADQYAKVSGLAPLREGLRDEVRFAVRWTLSGQSASPLS